MAFPHQGRIQRGAAARPLFPPDGFKGGVNPPLRFQNSFSILSIAPKGKKKNIYLKIFPPCFSLEIWIFCSKIYLAPPSFKFCIRPAVPIIFFSFTKSYDLQKTYDLNPDKSPFFCDVCVHY